MLTRPIPTTGEEIPAVGLGTWIGFDIGHDEEDRASRTDVLNALFNTGGTVIDSSPMYGRAEEVTGDLLAAMGARDRGFLATKVWTRGREEGRRQIEDSFRLMRTERMDLFQIHNLLDWRVHLETLRELKQAGRVRYIGITHYTSAALPDIARAIEAEQLDFVQLGYSLTQLEAADRVLPMCADKGVAVLVNRPFGGGGMFDRARGHDLPPWAAELDIASWGQYFLKFILAQPAVTCIIPGTGNPARAADDFASGAGRIPDRADARRMLEYWQGL